MRNIITNTAIVGGGASGLCAGIACARRTGSAVILERQPRTGRKLLATGNGRCNISNLNISPEHYHGDRAIIDSVIGGFTPEDLKDFFMSLGVMLRPDSEGRIYPYSGQASTVLNALRDECRRLKVEELCSFHISEIKCSSDGFRIFSDSAVIQAKNLVIASGSQAFPQSGADDSGYRLLDSLGISYTPLFPALCPVFTKERYKALKGVRAKGCVSLIADGKNLEKTEGEIQFTENGLSGICVFELSRAVNEFLLFGKADGVRYSSVKLSLDLMKELRFSQVCDYLFSCKSVFYDSTASLLCSGSLNDKLALCIAKANSMENKPCSSLTSRDIKQIAKTIKDFSFTPVMSDGFKSAQVSAGGVGSREADPRTLMSKKIKNLFICGELLDADGDCGGFNLHFAIGSALKLAEHISI